MTHYYPFSISLSCGVSPLASLCQSPKSLGSFYFRLTRLRFWWTLTVSLGAGLPSQDLRWVSGQETGCPRARWSLLVSLVVSFPCPHAPPLFLPIKCVWLELWCPLVEALGIKWKKVFTHSCPTLQPRLLCPWNSPGKDTGVHCHSLLQGIFVTQESNPQFSHIAGRFFTIWATREAFRY